MLAAHLNLVEHVLLVDRGAVFVEIVHGAMEVKERDHLLRAGRLVHHQCVDLAGRLVDERPFTLLSNRGQNQTPSAGKTSSR